MAEQLRLDQLLRDGGAVDVDEGLLGAQRVAVQRARDDLLAAAVLAGDEHARRRWRRAADLLLEFVHHLAVADEDLFEREVLTQIADLLPQPAVVEGVIDGEQNALEGERLLQKIVGTEARGLHRGFDAAVAGDHDDGRRAGVAQPFEHGQSVDAGKPEVEQDEIELVARVLGDPFLARLAERGLVSFVAEDVGEGGADGGLVVDDENSGH